MFNILAVTITGILIVGAGLATIILLVQVISNKLVK